jgi:hypothetical protein
MDYFPKQFKLLSLLGVAIVLVLSSCGSGNINKDDSLHSSFINKSKMENAVVVSLDTIFFKGDAYAILKETGISFSPFYEFYTLTGEKVIDILPYSAGDGKATSHHEYRFHGTSEGMKAYDDYSFSTISVCETVINNNLMNTTGLRAIDVGNFCKKHPRPAKFNPGALKVKREMTKAIKINQGYGEIYQDDKLIAKFTQGSDKSPDLKKSSSVFRITFLNTTLCATVTFGEYKPDRIANPNMEVTTEFDGNTHHMNIEEANTTYDVDAFKQAVQFLVSKGYL